MKASNFRTLVPMLAMLLLGGAGARAQEAHWLSDYSQALAQAKADNANILMDFTGSDWCPWCQRMDQEVLETPQFADYASQKKLVLMLVDFPMRTPLPQDVQTQNSKLQKQFGVDGFPTFILTDKDGNVMGKQVGYLPGGPSAFISALDGMKEPMTIFGFRPLPVAVSVGVVLAILWFASRPLGMGSR